LSDVGVWARIGAAHMPRQMHSKTTWRKYPPRAREPETLIAKMLNPVCVALLGACLYCHSPASARSARKRCGGQSTIARRPFTPQELHT